MQRQSVVEQQVSHNLTAKAVANTILGFFDNEGIPVSNLKLQKVIYFTHADFLKNQGLCLVRDRFQAWDHGPVLPNVYASFKKFGAGPIHGRAIEFDPVTATSRVAEANISPRTIEEMRRSFDFLKRLGAFTLSNLSHKDGGPWDRARRAHRAGFNPESFIRTQDIELHHAKMW